MAFANLSTPFLSSRIETDTMMGSGSGPGTKPKGEQWLDVAEKLLAASDLNGSIRFAERALDSDPLTPSDRADRIIAVSDVILASQSRENNHYSILGSSTGSDLSQIRSNYRRLSLLLNPRSNSLPFAAHAIKLVSDAYAVLSDPARKSVLDSEIRAGAGKGGGKEFWTACRWCCHVFLYDRSYLGLELLCQKCGRGFLAEELASAPPVVEGTGMYYCTWGYFPMGTDGPHQPRTHPPAEVAVGPGVSGRVKKMGVKKKGGAGGGIDINRGADDDDDEDDHDVVEIKFP